MAETMVAEFKRLPQRAYLGGYTSRFGSRTHFQLATFSALMRTPEVRKMHSILTDALEAESTKMHLSQQAIQSLCWSAPPTRAYRFRSNL